MNLNIQKATTDREIQGILELQQANLRKNLTREEMDKYGFVTLEYDYQLLQEMPAGNHHVIAKDGDKVIGYCLLFDRSKNHLMTEGKGIFPVFNKIIYKGVLLGESNYVSVGQVCVDRAYTGNGILGKMYAYYKSSYEHLYDFAMTDIASQNHRSIKGHLKAGFEILKTFDEPDAGEPWDIVIWDWRKNT